MAAFSSLSTRGDCHSTSSPVLCRTLGLIHPEPCWSSDHSTARALQPGPPGNHHLWRVCSPELCRAWCLLTARCCSQVTNCGQRAFLGVFLFALGSGSAITACVGLAHPAHIPAPRTLLTSAVPHGRSALRRGCWLWGSTGLCRARGGILEPYLPQSGAAVQH